VFRIIYHQRKGDLSVMKLGKFWVIMMVITATPLDKDQRWPEWMLHISSFIKILRVEMFLWSGNRIFRRKAFVFVGFK